MNYYDIQCFSEINEVDENKVNELVASMLSNGWQGMPILIVGESLLTGSHRLVALKKIDEMIRNFEIDGAKVLDQDIAEDVTEIVESKLQTKEDENGWIPDIEYDSIGWLLEGSWVEEYKNQVAEW